LFCFAFHFPYQLSWLAHSQWIDLDSPCHDTRCASEAVFKQELAWVSHLSLAAVLLPTPKPDGCVNYSRCIKQVIQELNYVQAWVRVPLIHPAEEDNSNRNSSDDNSNDNKDSNDSTTDAPDADSTSAQSADTNTPEVRTQLNALVKLFG
jgi:hypothetical protein